MLLYHFVAKSNVFSQREHQGVLDKARQEYEQRLQQAIERIAILTQDVEKYKCLAGLEKYSQNALSGNNLYTHMYI